MSAHTSREHRCAARLVVGRTIGNKPKGIPAAISVQNRRNGTRLQSVRMRGRFRRIAGGTELHR